MVKSKRTAVVAVRFEGKFLVEIGLIGRISLIGRIGQIRRMAGGGVVMLIFAVR